MGQRLLQSLFAELLAFGSFVLGGIALLGGLATAAGNSQHPALVSWGRGKGSVGYVGHAGIHDVRL